MNYTLPLALLLTFQICRAENFVVENLEDDGAGSLRMAITSANMNDSPDTITFADSLQTNGPHVITLDGPLNVTAPIEIIGPGRETLFISGDDNHRVFSLSGSTAANPHRLRNLTIQNGRATLGGANIRAFGSLEIHDCSILNGQATATNGNGNNTGNADGGGLFHSGGNLLIDSCLFQNNSTIGGFSQGGGFYTELGTATITNSRIVGNSTDGPVSEGGGIGSRSIMTLENCEITENETLNSSSGGGGIYADTNTTMRQCTISNNIVGRLTGISGYSVGGAFANVGGSATFENCTITGNSAPTGMGQGAGISSLSSGVLSFRNCIVSGNGTSDLDDPTSNRRLRYRDDGFNLFGTVTNTILSISANRDSTSTYGVSNPQLSTLGFHGGITRTQIPLPNSPALNSGPTTVDSIYDQRNTDFPRLIGTAMDIGACERQDFTDNDQDGIPDAIEALIPDLAASDGDLDQDGISDSVEFRLSGSQAVSDSNIRPSLQIQSLAGGTSLEFPTNPNREYRIVYNTDLVSPLIPLQDEFQKFITASQATVEVSLDEPQAFFFLEGRVPLEPTQ